VADLSIQDCATEQVDNAPEEQDAPLQRVNLKKPAHLPKRRHPPTRYAAPQYTIPKSQRSPPRRPEYLWKLNRLGKPCISARNEQKRYTAIIVSDVTQASFSNGFWNGAVRVDGRTRAYTHELHIIQTFCMLYVNNWYRWSNKLHSALLPYFPEWQHRSQPFGTTGLRSVNICR
jgi:hypothetical protein